MEQLARRVLLVLMDVDSAQMRASELLSTHQSMFGFKLSLQEVIDELQWVVEVSIEGMPVSQGTHLFPTKFRYYFPLNVLHYIFTMNLWPII